ncbi:MAG: GNAT family N-acetyltransferase [Acidimicrobiales bacterium]
MTLLDAGRPGDPVQGALCDLAASARRAGVSIRALVTPAEIGEVRQLMEAIWGPAVVVPRNVLRGMVLAGAPLLVAERDGLAVGFALGFLGWEGGIHFHSHQVGVVEAARGSGVGSALKLAQRLACLQHGVSEMRWTFDPLLRPNAAFNLQLLGAQVRAFLPDCYGPREDNFNSGERTDRLEVTWDLTRPLETHDGDDVTGPFLIDPEPLPHRSPNLPTPGSVIPIPEDYARLRRADRGRADAWRTAVGSALAEAVDSGLAITGFSSDGYLIGEQTK